jgi:hypothetical protein
LSSGQIDIDVFEVVRCSTTDLHRRVIRGQWFRGRSRCVLGRPLADP